MYGTHIELIPSLQDFNLRAGLFDSVFYASPMFLFFTNEQNLCRSYLSGWLVLLFHYFLEVSLVTTYIISYLVTN